MLYLNSPQSSKLSSIGALKELLEGEKEKVAQELLEEEEKVKAKSEKAAKKGKRRADPNNPTKEEVEAEQEVHEKLTWQDRYYPPLLVPAIPSRYYLCMGPVVICNIRPNSVTLAVKGKPEAMIAATYIC